MLKNIICPLSLERIDSTVSRLTVFTNALLMVWYLITLNPIPLYIVTLDYCIRAWGSSRFSPLHFLMSRLCAMLSIRGSVTDKAPKVFASRLGFICAFLGTLFLVVNMPIASRCIIGIFLPLALLDSVFDLCVGCMIYHHLVFPWYHNNHTVK